MRKIDGNIGFEACACADYECDEYRIETHCHRSTCKSRHPYACVHYEYKDGYAKEARNHAKKVQEYIREAYWCECVLKKGDMYDQR